MANSETKVTRISAKQKRENALNTLKQTTLETLFNENELNDFLNVCEKNDVIPSDVITKLIGLYCDETIKFQKKKVVQEILELL